MGTSCHSEEESKYAHWHCCDTYDWGDPRILQVADQDHHKSMTLTNITMFEKKVILIEINLYFVDLKKSIGYLVQVLKKQRSVLKLT